MVRNVANLRGRRTSPFAGAAEALGCAARTAVCGPGAWRRGSAIDGEHEAADIHRFPGPRHRPGPGRPGLRPRLILRKHVHTSSYEKVRAFRDAYLETSDEAVLSVLDVGSMAHKEQDTYRPLFAGAAVFVHRAGHRPGAQRRPRTPGRLPLGRDPQPELPRGHLRAGVRAQPVLLDQPGRGGAGAHAGRPGGARRSRARGRCTGIRSTAGASTPTRGRQPARTSASSCSSTPWRSARPTRA